MLYNTMELCLFCDAGLTHNAIFNYYLLPLKKKKILLRYNVGCREPEGFIH